MENKTSVGEDVVKLELPDMAGGKLELPDMAKVVQLLWKIV